MRKSHDGYDLWRLPNFALWLVFFGIGLIPEPVYDGLRALGAVVTQRAVVNSPYFITVGCAVYLAVFWFHKCREAQFSERVARGSALQHGMVALLAFLPLPPELVLQAPHIPVASIRHLIYGASAVKILAWAYLFLVVGYSCVSGKWVVSTAMSRLFPSVRRHNRTGAPASADDGEGNATRHDGVPDA